MKKIIRTLILCSIVFAMACSHKNKNQSITVSNFNDVTEINITDSANEKNLVKEELSMLKYELEETTGNDIDLLEYAQNSENVYYTKCYYIPMTIYTYYAEVYCYNIESKTHTLIYQKENISNLNELRANDDYVVWVEYIPEGEGFDYSVMLYDSKSGDVSNIATINSDYIGEICLSISKNYVTWYEYYYNEERVEVSIYDINDKSTYQLENEDIVLFYPYERLDIVDDGITFFTKNDEGNVEVNRYNIKDKTTFSLVIEEEMEFAGCMSNQDYIGWFTNYNNGRYYFYHMDSDKIYTLNSLGNLTFFDVRLEDKLYINERTLNRIYVYDFMTDETVYQNLGESIAFTFYGADNKKISMKLDEGNVTKSIRIIE